MKNKTSSLFTHLLTVIVLLFSFVACDKERGNVSANVVDATETLVVIKIDEVDGDVSVLDVLKVLEKKNALTFDSKEGAFGAYIVSVNGKTEISGLTEGYSWMVYTSDRTDGVANTEGEPLVVDGINYYSTLVGVSSISVKEGEYYLLSFESWSFS